MELNQILCEYISGLNNFNRHCLIYHMPIESQDFAATKHTNKLNCWIYIIKIYQEISK